jgi:hypothetical protein
VDKETDLPLLMIIYHLSCKVPRRMIMSDFDFTTPLDASLFSTEPPTGYSVTSQQL